MNPKYEELMEHVEKTEALKAAIVLFDWDTETLAPPRMIGSLSAQYFDATVNGRMRELLAALKDAEDLSEAQAAVVRKLNKDRENMEKIPPEEYREFSELQARSTSVWARARQNR